MSVARRIGRVLAIAGLVIVALLAIGVIVIETPSFKDWLRGFAVRQASTALNGQLSIGRLSGSLFTGVQLSNVAVTMNGQQVVAARDVSVGYNIITLIRKGIDLHSIRIDEPVVHVRRTRTGWNLASLVKSTPSSGPARPVSIADIVINDGTVYVQDDTPPATRTVNLPRRVERINARLGFTSRPDYLDASIHRFSARARDPQLDLHELSGTLIDDHGTVKIDRVKLRTSRSGVDADGTVRNAAGRNPVINASLTSGGVAIDEFAPFVPALRSVPLRPSFSLRAQGPENRLAATLQMDAGAAGRVDGSVTADLTAPNRRARGTLHLHHLDAAPVAGPALASDITAEVSFNVSLPASGGPSGSYAITAPQITAAGYHVSDLAASGTLHGPRVTLDAHAQAYGTHATMRGSLVRSPELAYDLTGTFRGANLRALPASLKVPAVSSDLNADLHVTGRGQTMNGHVRLGTSHVAGATIANGTRATFSKRGSRMTYTATGGITGLDLQRAGRAFHITTLDSARYQSRINARFSVSGQGTSLPAMNLDATGTLTNSSLLGGRVPHLALQAHLRGGAVRARVTGAFTGLDPALASGRPPLKGAVSGTMNLTASVAHLSGPFDPAAITADGRLALTDSSIGAFTLRGADLDARFANAIGQIRQFTVASPDLNVRVAGTLSLAQTTPSNLTYHLDTSRLATIGALVNQPVKGTLRVDGRVSGNRAALETNGNLTASNLAYGSNQVLSITSNFLARVPNLQATDGHYEAHASATFVKVAGQEINQLALNATYEKQRLTFQTTAKQAPRQMQAAGLLVFYPNAAELHLRQLALSTTGLQWNLASGRPAVIRYGQGRTEIRSLALTSQGQALTVNGVIAPSGSNLSASLHDIDLSDIQKLLLINRHIGGRLDASAHITGTSAAPIVDARLNVMNGAFRTFTFQSAGGTARYSPAGIAVDLRLQQNPAAWLTVKGTAPMSLFSAAKAGTAAGSKPVDLDLQTSTIDLGIVQGFTTLVTKAKGTFQAQVHVGGTGASPALQGYLALDNGSFAVPAAGTHFSGMNVRVNLLPDRVQIARFTILDEDHQALNMTGQLAMHAKSLGAVKINVSSNRFQIIENNLADIQLATGVQVTGQLLQPHVNGTITIQNGKLDIARLMALVGSSPYSTHPLASPSTRGKTAEVNPGHAPAPPTPGAPRATRSASAAASGRGLAMNVRIHLPDDFVIKGSNIQPPGSSFGVGDVNLTLGGDLHVIQPPGGQMKLNGIIHTVRGLYIFQGRRFQIARNGEVRFENVYPPNPALNITATRTIQGVQAQIHVAGTAKAPQLTLSSNPPLDQGDILSLIVFNQPTNQLGEGQRMSLAQRAKGLASSFLAGSLARSLGTALGVDLLQIDTAPEGGGGPEVTVGQQVTSGLYVQVQQEVGAGSATQFQLEYEFTNFMRLRTEANTGSQVSQTLLHRVQQEGIDLIFFFSY